MNALNLRNQMIWIMDHSSKRIHASQITAFHNNRVIQNGANPIVMNWKQIKLQCFPNSHSKMETISQIRRVNIIQAQVNAWACFFFRYDRKIGSIHFMF